MTPQSITTDSYVASVIMLYLQLPDTPLMPSTSDNQTAAALLSRGVPFHVVEAALLLASVRRLSRPPTMPPLPPVRSLAYFIPIIEELCHSPLPDAYSDYLRLKLRSLAPR